MKRVIVVGGGAAGMMAAIQAASKGHQVLLFEKNEKLGKKIYITGKGRCNITNHCEVEELFRNVPRNGKFLYSAFYTFDNRQTISFFEENGLSTKVERGGRVFPVSDHSSDVISVLQKKMLREKVEIHLNTAVMEILQKEGEIYGVRLKNGKEVTADVVIIATGGCSYPATGSTGDGYVFAEKTGHKVMPRFPSLVPYETEEIWVKDLMGVSLKNVEVTIKKEKKILYQGFGEMLFTHFGVSGPLILSASSLISQQSYPMPLDLRIDLKPALDMEQLDKRILRDFSENPNKTFKNAIQKLFPSKMIPVMISLSKIPEEKKVNSITKGERNQFVSLIKNLPLTITGTRGFREAIITRGGVSVKDVNPATMESKKVKGLYFAGEVLDLDALTGGFNLQIAWSTGYLAGESLE